MTKGHIWKDKHIPGTSRSRGGSREKAEHTYKWEMQINGTKRIENCVDEVESIEQHAKEKYSTAAQAKV